MSPSTKHWCEHRIATTPAGIVSRERAEARDLRTVAGRGRLLFHIRVGGDEMRPIIAAFRGDTRLRAEQAALAWCRTRWARDRRELFIEQTEIIESEGGDQ